MLEKNHFDNDDPSWKIHMQTLMKRKKNMEISQIIDDAIWKYYFEKGIEVPNWKREKDPQWWIDYLKELGLDQRNS